MDELSGLYYQVLAREGEMRSNAAGPSAAPAIHEAEAEPKASRAEAARAEAARAEAEAEIANPIPTSGEDVTTEEVDDLPITSALVAGDDDDEEDDDEDDEPDLPDSGSDLDG
ncbi:ribosomal L1 domain-containing protein CG13096-like [Cynara cardunculus var. scolymus]|uniref:ribosomal L1 domain-containing protein CG13096-like n=1 Tax=Cynara cardunculus var. scolymus TaxID=59895 RepID=UPI000D624796|nr:ribosomal L1 domain-containing protein CG13096-like [Cynara cardunculus var. scolymus]